MLCTFTCFLVRDARGRVCVSERRKRGRRKKKEEEEAAEFDAAGIGLARLLALMHFWCALPSPYGLPASKLGI